MKRHVNFSVIFTAVCVLAITASAQKTFVPDLKGIPFQKGWKLSNRKVQIVDKDGKPAAEFDAREGDGLVWLEGNSFANGTIECDINTKENT